jgi:cytochrome c553
MFPGSSRIRLIRMPLNQSVCWSTLLVAGLLATGSASAQNAGKQKATQMCVVCHGLNGIGLNPDVPNLAGESPLYLEKQLNAFRTGERKHEQMSIIAQGLKDEDIRDLVAWYSSLKVTVEVPQ